MHSDYKPILFNTPNRFPWIEVYFIHDLHYGNHLFMEKKWNALKKEILQTENAYCIFIGDAMENAVPNSKSDVFTQIHPPQEQKEWFADQLTELKDRTIAVVSGNHETNRSFKLCGLYPLYDCCLLAGIPDAFRQHFAVIDIGVGNSRGRRNGRQMRYYGYVIHKGRDMKNFSTADTIDGIDFFAYGHDHDPKDHARAKLVYDATNKKVTTKSIETINSGSFLKYGGYAADAGYRPQSEKIYKLILNGNNKKIDSVGFYL